MDYAKKILSVVIPTYNMEKYLCDCLDSVTREDVPSSLDLILVNDGSTDSSLEIMQKYQKKRPDIITIIDKSNGHYGSCINAGLNIAKGKYFRPLDADDWFDTNMLIKMINKLEKTDADLVITPRTEISEGKKVFSLDVKENQLFQIEHLRKKVFRDISGILSMHSMTYRLDLLKKIHLSLLEGVCYTDTEYFLIPLQHANTFIFYNLELYQYRLGREGQSVDDMQFEKNRSHLSKVICSILEKTQMPLHSIEYNYTLNLLVKYYGMILFDIISDVNDYEDMQILYRTIKKHHPHLWIMTNKCLYFVPFIWHITGLNFNFYTKFKKYIGKKSIFHGK